MLTITDMTILGGVPTDCRSSGCRPGGGGGGPFASNRGGLITNRLALPAGIPRAHPYLRSRIHEDAVCGADPRPLG